MNGLRFARATGKPDPAAWQRLLLGAVLAGAMWLGGVTPAMGADPFEGVLAERPWRHDRYGVSLRPPLNTRIVRHDADDAVVRIQGHDYHIVVWRKQRRDGQPLTVKQTLDASISQMARSNPQRAAMLGQEAIEIDGRPAAVVYFEVPSIAHKHWVTGQAFVSLNDKTVLMLEAEMPRGRLDAVKPIFEAVLETVELEDPQALARERAKQIAAGEAWMKSLKERDFVAAAGMEVWMRILDQGHEVGYLHQRVERQRVMGDPGFAVAVNYRIDLGEQRLRSEGEFYTSTDGRRELWNMVTEIAEPARPGERIRFVESGLREGAKLELQREIRGKTTDHSWKPPVKGYLSHSHVHLLGFLLARNPPDSLPASLGFYAYYPNEGGIVFRTVRIEAGEGREAYRIFTRPSPIAGEQMSAYDTQGRWLRSELPDGRVMTPGNAAAIRARWMR